MNKDNLHELINRYEANFDMLNGKEHDELFKWKAMKTWRDEWFKPNTAFSSFADRFNEARKDFNIFIDNKVMHPSNGVIELWEQNPRETRLRCSFPTLRRPLCWTRDILIGLVL